MKRFAATLLALTLLLSLAACGPGESAQTPEPSGPAPTVTGGETTPAVDSGAPLYGGSATFYYSDFNQVFDPAMGEAYTYSLWLETLWTMDWGLNDPSVYGFKNNSLSADTVAGQIVDTWEWTCNGDGTSDLAVTIRDDIYFQEKDEAYDVFGGRNLTAADVAYSYDRLWGTGSCAGKAPVVIDADWLQRMDGLIDLENPVEVTGDYSLVFHLTTESEPRLSEFMIAQINITGPEWDTLTDAQKNDWHYACGTGPYILTDYVAGSHYTFTKNENYYDYDERHPENKLPYLNTVTLTSVADATAAMSAFIAGNLDYIAITANLSEDQTAQLKAACGDSLRELIYPYSGEGLSLKVNQAPFNDIRVRVAMQKAINLEEVNAAYFGYDTPVQYAGLWDPTLAGWSATDEWDSKLVDEYTYDPEAAKALLADAGYPDGFSFTVAVDNMADVDLFQLAKSYLSAIGINMDIQVLSDMMEGRQIQGDPNDPRQFNMNIGTSVDAGFAYQTFATDGFAYCNYHEDTHMNELLFNTRGATTLEDQAAYAKQTDLYFSQQHWTIALSGITQAHEYLASRIGGLENGELLSAYHLTKPILARVWAKDAQ